MTLSPKLMPELLPELMPPLLGTLPFPLSDKPVLYVDGENTKSLVNNFVILVQTVSKTGANELTASADVSSDLFPGILIEVAGSDIFEVVSVATNVITTVETVVTAYSADTLGKGIVEELFNLASSKNITQNVGDDKPALIKDGGFRAVSFDYVDDFLERGDSFGLVGNPAITIMMVVKLVTGVNYVSSMLRIGSPTSLDFNVSANIGDRFRVFATDINEFFTTISGNIQLLTITKPAGGDNTTAKFYINGTEITGSPTGTTGINLLNDEFTLGKGNSGEVLKLFSIFMAKELFSDSGRQELENFFINQYGI